MEYTNLGRTGLTVSRLCLGTMNFGPQTTEPDSFAIMDRALEHGINFFDTANVYGWKLGEGVTEQIIGRWFAQGGGRREKVVLATKVYGKMGDWPNDQGLSARHIVTACEASLRRLQTDCIDLYQMHHVSPDDAVGGDLAGDGDRSSRRARCSTSARPTSPAGTSPRRRSRPTRRHFLGLVSEQCIYNLLTRHVELEVMPGGAGSTASASSRGRRCTAGCSAARCASSPRARRPRPTAGRAGRQPRASTGPPSRRTRSCAPSLGEDPANVALAWLLSRPGVTAPIIGPRTVEQLDATIRAVELHPRRRHAGHPGRLFPPIGNGGPGPEAWAW